MLMDTKKLLLLRCYAVTLGRFRFGARWLRKLLVRRLIEKGSQKYVASSRYFTRKELEP